ncbi:hypothetical protein FB451DRAFT_1142682 [Mycena latifolia]|nr:hypothetical protein FB451DRAFT_1142682 [Mycena latifolia]
MHRCLGILEIIELICEHLEGAYLTQDGRKACAALARTCKDFHGPALDVLWRIQYTLENIIKCLPSNLWEERVGPWGVTRVRIIGVIHPGDWEIPLGYARRIQELRFNPIGLTYPFPDVDTLDTISSSLPQGYLCPNLRSITWEPSDDVSFPYIRLFLGPKVTSAYFSLPGSIVSNISLLPNLTLRYPELKSLRIQGIVESALLRRASSAIVLDLNRIEYLAVDALDRPALDHLSRLPGLKSLNIRIPQVTDLGPPPPSRSHYSFPALRTIQFSSTTIEFAIEFVNLLSDCRLEEINVGTDVLATKATTGELYTALANRLSHSPLDWLWIGNVDEGITATPAPSLGTVANYVINGHTLAALFCFTNLTTVGLEPPVGFGIDDITAWDMARAWPKIRSLKLASATDLHHPTSMTLHGLRAFAQHCRDLTWLSITVDASTVPPFDNSPETRISQRQLSSFDVGASLISDPPTVARFMSGLFPALVEISTVRAWRWDEPDEYDDEEEAAQRARHAQWNQVEVLVPIIAAIREEERLWAGVTST